MVEEHLGGGMPEVVKRLSEFIQLQSTVGTSPLSFFACLLVALSLGVALTLLYRLYFVHHDAMDASLARSLTLMTPALSVIFLVVQTSLALSVGVLGSLAFVRFRTPVKRAEDVTFILFAMAVALLCSVSLYAVAVMLVGLLLVFAWVFNLVMKRYRFRPRFAVVTINTRKTDRIGDLEGLLASLRVRPHILSTRTYDGLTSFVVNVHNLGRDEHARLLQGVQEWDQAVQISVFYPTESLTA